MSNPLKGISAATRALKRHEYILPVEYGTKICRLPNWPNILIANHEAATQYFGEEPSNVATLNGKNNVIDIDCDDDNFALLWSFLGIPTEMIFGREGQIPGHHLYKIVGKMPKTGKFCDSNGAVIAEIRAKNSCTLIPPSIHSNGDKLVYTKDGKPTEVSNKKLKQKLSITVGLALLARNYPAKGTRHQFVLAVSGLMATGGIPEKAARRYLNALLKAAKDPERVDRLKCLKDTYRKFNQGNPVSGYQELSKTIVPKDVQLIASYLRAKPLSEEEKLVADMNRIYAFVMIGSSAKILEEKPLNPLLPIPYELLEESAFRKKFRNKVLSPKDINARSKRNYADVWLNSPIRREYDEIFFCPSNETRSRAYNTWRGFPLPALNSGSCERFLEHCRDVICAGIEGHYKWLINLLAFNVQFPDLRSEVCLALVGKQGVGKSIFLQYLGKIYGSYFMTVSQEDHLTGKFNYHLDNKLLLIVEEGTYLHSKNARNILKDLITNPSINIEAKGRDVLIRPNYLQVFFTSNEYNVLPSKEQERRFAILAVSESRKGDEKYFDEFAREMQNGGPEKLLSYLLNVSVSKDLIKQKPKSDAVIQSVLKRMPDANRFIYIALKNGTWIENKKKWRSISTSRLFKRYCESSSQHLTKSLESELGRSLKGLLGNTCIKSRKRNSKSKQIMMYEFSSLTECREEFSRNIGIEIDWETS